MSIEKILSGATLDLIFAAGLIVVVASAFLLFYSLLPLLDTPEQKSKKRVLLIVFFGGTFIFITFWLNQFDLKKTQMFCFLILREYSWFIVPMTFLLGGFHLLFWKVICPRFLWPCEFKSEDWKKADLMDRKRMVEDLLEKKLLDLRSEQEVIDLLGKPERVIDGLWEYRLGEDSSLSLLFDQSKKVRKVQKTR